MAESDAPLVRLNDFEWASGCRYILYVSRVVGLTEVSGDAINSLRIGQHGVEKVRASKKRTLATIEANIDLLGRWGSEKAETLTELEKVILRSMYTSLVAAKGKVADQLETLVVIEAMKQGSFDEGGAENDLPF